MATDKTKMMSTILLLNGYYDFRTGTPWTPYLGGGLGFTVNQLTRNLDVTPARCGTNIDAGNRSTDMQFAAAAMAGVTYDVSSFFAIDVNYRFLHIGGSDVGLDTPTSPRQPRSAVSTNIRSALAYGFTSISWC